MRLENVWLVQPSKQFQKGEGLLLEVYLSYIKSYFWGFDEIALFLLLY